MTGSNADSWALWQRMSFLKQKSHNYYNQVNILKEVS